jgi:hypothetical protein
VQGDEAAAEPQQDRLAGAIRPAHVRDLTLVDLERDSGEEGEATGEGNGFT